MAGLNLCVIETDDVSPNCCVLYLDDGKASKLLFSGEFSEELLERIREFTGRPMLLLMNPADSFNPPGWSKKGDGENVH